ncbi:MAG: FecR family protein [Flavobacteriaceae bacterium]|nr:FecR family protein [Flavobacteriaceae bacterium]
MKKENLHIINKFLDNSIESSEENELENWIKKESNQNKFEEVVFANHFADLATTNFDTDYAFEKFEKEIEVKKKKGLLISLKKYYKYAAILLIALFAGLYLFKNDLSTNTNFTNIVVPRSETRNFELPDGSKININSGTTFSYNKDFLNNRLVKLKGEAFFDVTKLDGKPFVIMLNNDVQIKVLGTSFGVKSYDEDVKIQTSLVEGKIELISKSIVVKNFIIEPNTTAIIDKDNKSIQVIKDKVFTENTLFWKENTFYFNKDYLGDIINEFNRNFNVKIKIQSEELKKQVFTATFKKEISLETMLNELSITGGFKLIKKDNQHFIISNKTNSF